MKFISLLFSFCFLFSACSTVPYNPRRSVKVEKRWYGTSFLQGENRVNPSDIAKKLGRKPQNKKQVEAFNSNYKLSQALGILGGFGFLWAAGGGFNESGTLIGSLLMGGASLYFAREAAHDLSPLVENRNKFVYNYSVLPKERMTAQSLPLFMLPIVQIKF